MRQRYGIGGGGLAGAPPPSLSSPMNSGMPTAPAAPSGPSVILDEKPLRVILQLDFVKPKPEAEPSARRAARPAPAADGATTSAAETAAPATE